MADRVRAHLYGPLESVLAFLETGLRLVAEALELYHPTGSRFKHWR